MIIFGLDPGTATTGFGVIEYIDNQYKVMDYGCILTAAKTPLAQRLIQITNDLDELLKQWKPDSIAIEELFFSKNVKTAMSVSHARGAMIERITSHGYPLAEYKPNEVKEAICGYGRAEKWQMQKMVKLMLNLATIPKPDDAADALAIAICHAHNYKYKKQIEL